MEKSVSGIRKDFYYHLIDDYKKEDEEDDKRTRTTSFLYRYFWEENVVGLLEKYFPWISIERPLLPECLPKDESQIEKQLTNAESRIKKQLTEAVKERTEWDRSLLLRAVPEKGRKERRDFWVELWLNDIGYKAGLISDSEYYLWLVEYLAVRDIYYKDNSIANGHLWLRWLLFKGLQDAENELAREQLRKNKVNILTKTQVGQALAELAKLIQEDRDTVSGRLHGLEIIMKNKKGERKKKDYLPWLTAQLEKMALHIKIKTWLQDSGYPLSEEKTPKESRKQDFSMRLFEAYCDSEEGYEFIRKEMGGRIASRSWRVDGNGFCIMDEAQIAPLLTALKESKTDYLYLPLAVDLFSGCIFFLAGKGNYEKVYDKEDIEESLKKEYKDAIEKADFCFDYLRLNPEKDFSGTMTEIFQLAPTFHKNVGRSYKVVMDEFKWYCESGSDKFGNEIGKSNNVNGPCPRDRISWFNEKNPDNFPKAFRWAFRDPDK